MISDTLLNRITDKSARIGVVGMGYVGLPLALAFCSKGFEVVGVDIDPNKVASLNGGCSYLKHISSDRIAAARDSGKLSAVSDFAGLGDVDSIILCVPTPLTKHREPDLSYIEATIEMIAGSLRPGQLVVLESTTYPGTTREVVQPRLEATGLKVGVDVFLAFSPEREDPGNLDFETTIIPKVLGADDDQSRDLAMLLYSHVISAVVPVSTAATAEAVKLTENIFRAVNIALVNELKVVFDRMEIDIWEVIEAAKTKPFGYMPFYPGPGLGGHCIPIDPFYLTWKAREFEINTKFIELAGEVNASMPFYAVDRLIEALSTRHKKSLADSKILIVGLAYKKNLDDTRESPALKIMRLVEERGARVSFFDPFLRVMRATREYPEFANRESILWKDLGEHGYDAAVICTDHDDIDFEDLADKVQLVIDTRNAYGSAAKRPANVVMA